MKLQPIIFALFTSTLMCVAFSCKESEDERSTPKENDNKTEKQKTNIAIYVADNVTINPDLFGVNNDWKFISDEAFPIFAAKFKELNLGKIRYPGGWESEWVDWESNTAPQWKDEPELSGASIMTLKSNIADYSIVVPTQRALKLEYGTDDWDKATNALKLTAKEAIEKAGASQIKYVEIGNEWWLQWAGGVSRGEKLKNYSKLAMNLTGYLSQQYPDRSFKILINGDFTQPQEFAKMKDYFTAFYDEIDGIALHTYTGYQPEKGKENYDIATLGEMIESCAKNFNPNKKLIVYASEWMAARAYNEGRIYMEAANIIPDIMQIYAMAGVDAAAYWPPVNSTVPGVGLLNWSGAATYPCGQILSEMATSFKGKAVKTVSDSKIKIAAALQDSEHLVLFVTGKDNLASTVTVNLHNFKITQIKNIEKFRPADYMQTNKAAPYIVHQEQQIDFSPSSFSFEINKAGSYEIFKFELTGEPG